jgi:hypothetical protein
MKFLIFLLVIYTSASVPISNAQDLVDTKICVGLKNGVTIQVKNSCTEFYICVEGKGYLENCENYGSALQFNPITGDCDFESTVKCVEQLKLYDMDTNICIGQSDRTTIGVRGSCAHFYRCIQNIGYLDDCNIYGYDLFYDPTIGACNDAEKVDCYDLNLRTKPFWQNPYRSEKAVITLPIAIVAPDFDAFLCKYLANESLIPIKGSCSLYYECFEKNAYLKNCKDLGEYQFNPASGECQFKRIIKCNEADESVISNN